MMRRRGLMRWRRRSAGDPDETYVRLAPGGDPYLGTLLPPPRYGEDIEDYDPREPHWSQHGAEMPAWVAAAEDSLERLRLTDDGAGGEVGVELRAEAEVEVEPGAGVAAVKRRRRPAGRGKAGTSSKP